MFRFMIMTALTFCSAIYFPGEANADPATESAHRGHRLDKTDLLVITSNELLPAQVIQLAPEQWQQPGANLFRIDLSPQASTYSPRWLKLPIRNSTTVKRFYRLVIAQPILSETQVYVHDQYDHQNVIVRRSGNVEGVSSYSFAVGPDENKDIYIKIQFGLSIPPMSLWQEDKYQANNHRLANQHWASLGIISTLLILALILLPMRLINPLFVVFNLMLIALWATLNGQWLSEPTPFWLTKTLLGGLIILAALARYQRFTSRLIAIKRLIAATIIAISLWFIPPSYDLLAFIALPVALVMLMLNAIEPPGNDHKNNKYSRWELVCFLGLGATAVVATSLGLANAFGYAGNQLNLTQALQIAIIANLLALVLSCVLRLKSDLAITLSEQKFTKNLQHQVSLQHATISQLNAEIKISHDRLKIDELTGLRNHDYFDANLALEINRTRRHKFPISLLMIKINGLGGVTEQYDYETSNKCLQQLAIRCQKQLKRSSDKVCRYRDETFALILPDTHSQGAMHLGQQLLDKINTAPLIIDNKRIAVSVNIGIASGISDPTITVSRLVETAEMALENVNKTSENPISQIIMPQ